jgi:hypothetical protein
VTQRMPVSPAAGQATTIYVKAGYQFQINTCFIYYTTDGSNPEGAYGTGKGTTQVVQAHFANHDSAQSNIDWWYGILPGQSNGTQVRYKVALFYGGSAGGANISQISDAESSGSKLYGLSQFAITNFNPTTATVWLHNDLNPANTATGLSSGFHIVRSRTFLPRTNQSSVYNTFLETFYYDGALPTGVIAFPGNGSTIGSSSYTVVVRADSTVTGVDFNIQDSNAGNDDVTTHQSNGNGNDTNGAPVFAAATPVTPDATLSATFTNYPQEYRFVYTSVPSSGAATINVRLKEFATSVYTNRYTLLTTPVTTQAPTQVVQISSPATNGVVLTYNTNSTYLLQACFSASLTGATNNFNVLINGVLQPQTSYIIRSLNSIAACSGYQSLSYNWRNPALGTNLIQVIYTNGVVVSDTRLLTVAPPLRISGLANNNQLILWDSAPGVNYQVFATTNLAQSFQPISNIVPSQGTTTSFYDPDLADQKFYEIEMMQ